MSGYMVSGLAMLNMVFIDILICRFVHLHHLLYCSSGACGGSGGGCTLLPKPPLGYQAVGHLTCRPDVDCGRRRRCCVVGADDDDDRDG